MKIRSAYALAFYATLAVGVAGLSACSPKPEEPTVGQRVDGAINSAERAGDKAKQDVKEMTQEAKSAGSEAMEKVGAGLSDAAITTSVNAELAKDSQLSALAINVDTVNGKVVLKGKAPTSDARTRATSLATAVKGVVSVDNQLVVDARG